MKALRLTLAGFATAMLAGVLYAQQGTPTAPAAEPGRVAVLDTYGIWRMSSEIAPPVLASGEEAKLKYRWLNYKTPAVQKGWQAIEFDDRSWNRGPATLATRSAMATRICLRGKFTVTDPAAVKDLKLSVGYHGGLVVFVNGKEVKREHIAAGQALAEGPGGEDRTLADFPIEAKDLRKGLNVLGLEIVRAPYPAEGGEKAEGVFNLNTCEVGRVQLTAGTGTGLVPNAVRPEGFQVWNADVLASDYDLDFGDTAEGLRPVVIVGAKNGMFSGKVVAGSTKTIKGLKAVAGDLKGPGGVIPAANVDLRYGIPAGDQAISDETRLNSNSPYTTFPTLLGGLAPKAPADVEPTTFDAMKVQGGVLYVNSKAPIKSPMGSKTPGCIRFRGFPGGWYDEYPVGPEVAKPVGGAVVPVWIGVKVSATVGAGTYTGTVKITAEGEKAVDVPVEVRVSDYTLPNVDNYRTFVDMIECPDTLALEYNVPMWSDKHFELIAESFKLMGQAGCRIVYVPLLCHSNIGDEESMVRWIKKPDGKYGYDFSIMERYLDTAEKNMGKPKIIVFLAWDVYMIPKDIDPTAGVSSRVKATRDNLDSKGATYGRGPMVTVLDPATQKTETVELPTHFEQDGKVSVGLWKPLFDELHARLRKRDLDDKMMLGIIYDSWPTKQDMTVLNEAAGNVPWAIESHEGFVSSWSNFDKAETKLMHGISKIGYQARVWAVTFSDDNADRGKGYRGGIESHRGWGRADVVTLFDRFSREHHPNTRWLQMMEVSITGSQCGLGRLGADYWPVVKNAKGQKVGRTFQRYPESDWRNLFIADGMLAPGPDGPVATNRMECLREGVQESEAYIVLERAVTDEASKAKLGPELTKRCEDYLHARHMMLWLSLSDLQLYGRNPGEAGCAAGSWRGAPNMSGHEWFMGSGWRERVGELYSLAGEVTRKLGGS